MMEKLNNKKEIKKSKFLTKAKYIISAIAITLAAENANSQNTTNEKVEDIKKWIEKYIPKQDQNYFNWALEELQEEDYIWQNINAFMESTIGKLPKEEDQILGKLIAINLMFTDSVKNTDHIERSPSLEVEIENFYKIYRNWRTEYRKYLINREKIEDERSNKRKPKFLKKDPSKVQKPKYEDLENSNINYLNFARETVKKDFPLDEPIMEICIAYIEEDEYIKTNVQKFLSKTVGTLPEKERWIATLQAISFITRWLTSNWLTITTTFAERNHVKLSEKSQDKISEFLSKFTDWWVKYVKYAKKTRKF